MITIDEEARRNKRLPIDLDNFSEKLKTSNDLYVFTTPGFPTLEKNLYYLLVNSEERQFNPKYKYKPSYLSFDEYGTVILSPILMYVNNVMCIEDFNLKTVIIPTFSSIKEICKDKIPKITPDEMNKIDW